MKKQLVLTEAFVKRPIDAVWAIIGNPESYRAWNDTYWFVDTTFEEGAAGKLGVNLGLFPIVVPILIEEVEENHIIRWGAGMGRIHGSHFLRLVDAGDGVTQILHGETFRGMGAFWHFISEGMRARYQRNVDDLVRYIEAHA